VSNQMVQSDNSSLWQKLLNDAIVEAPIVPDDALDVVGSTASIE
jgi:hypothetical protein